jgi:hypothetical protein
MNLNFYSDPTERALVTELMDWSKVALEKPSVHFNGFPPCPFAKAAWLDNKVSVIFKKEDSYQTLYSCISQYDDTFDLVIIVDLKNTKNPEDFHEYLDTLNDKISEGMFIDKDIWLMGFNPEDEPSDFVADVTFNYEVDDEYSLIFVQRLSKLQESANKLDKKGYYDSYKEEYNSLEIYQNRENLYRRLKDGNET